MRLSRVSCKWRCSTSIALLSGLLVAACGEPASPPAGMPAGSPATATSTGMRNFTGDWTVTGNRRVLDLLPGQRAGIFQLSGSLLLGGKERLNRGFYAEAIGFSDTTTGMQGRSVWVDEHGDKVFSELGGEGIGPGQLIEGKFIGGTGRYAGISGEYTFKWQRLGAIEGDELAGRVVDLSGWARLGTPNVVSPTTAGGPK